MKINLVFADHGERFQLTFIFHSGIKQSERIWTCDPSLIEEQVTRYNEIVLLL